MFGFHGGYLRVDAGEGKASRVAVPEAIYRQFLGGVGFGAWVLMQESRAGFDPLSSEAPLVFSFSPLVGTPLTTSAKFAVVAKSPLTQRICDALSSSHFALAGKKTGADAIVLTGQSIDLALLVVDDGKVEKLSAEAWRGVSARETGEEVQKKLGPDFQVAAIGPAGENGVLFANLSHEKRHAGRGGLGAVLGAKRIKALAVRGSQRVDIFDSPGVVEKARALSQRSFGPATAKYRELGTLANLPVFNRLNILPSKNFQQGSFLPDSGWDLEDGSKLRKAARHSCAACTIGCEHLYEGKAGQVRVEYESMFALGSLVGIEDPQETVELVHLCDALGLDTISSGGTIAFAMECVEKGWLDEPWLTWGNSRAIEKALKQIVSGEGVGKILRRGTRLAAEVIGHGAREIAPQVKGLELPGYEPRGLQSMALGLAVSTRGADHNRSGAYEADFSPSVDRFHGDERSAFAAVESENRAAWIDSLILCKFLRGVFTDFYEETAELVRLVTGWDFTAMEAETLSRRVVNLKKQFNIREGWTRDEDTLPPRFLQEPLPLAGGGSANLPAERLEKMIAAYYHHRGWTTEGQIPSGELTALGLDPILQ
ncbi:MAG: aldehyde:ferredoxin oxidoreductase [Gemmataceae bacterium]|nr:aldehyde:ferredoxin oxidoreductase [Gemmataceae bacterium]